MNDLALVVNNPPGSGNRVHEKPCIAALLQLPLLPDQPYIVNVAGLHQRTTQVFSTGGFK